MDKKDDSNKFFIHETNRKKIAALVNFSETLEEFTDWLALEYLAAWMGKGPLDSEGTRFLDHLLQKWGINYLDWSYRTLWVRKQIACKRSEQFEFVFDDLEQDRLREWRNTPLPSFINRHRLVQLYR